MTVTTLHVSDQKAELLLPARRVEDWLRQHKLNAKEIAVSADLDVRTAKSVLEGNCSFATFGALSAAFGWDFIEYVMTPVVGADPITQRERELHEQLENAAALQARLERARAVRLNPSCVRPALVGQGAEPAAQRDGERRSFGRGAAEA